jgi:NAD(P)-dependent dehydrogenase (short-subunit alcohol dehydrogenase family)
MGAQIAAHFANAGVPALLLDLTREAAREGLERAKKLKPDPFFTPGTQALVRTGGFEEDMAGIARCDWILEAVVERLEVKQSLFARVESQRRPDAIVSSNTSGIPIASLASGRSDGFRRNFLGTHFFNPPRYLRLLEIIPTAETDPAVVEFVTAFAERRLGKGVVVAKDTPNFIANHLGLYGVMQIFRAMAGGDYTIEEIDEIVALNLTGTIQCMQLAALMMREHPITNACIVVVSSIRGLGAVPGRLIYAATKAGINQAVRVAAAEVAPLGIRVNILSPGITETPLTAMNPDVFAEMTATVPMGRAAQPRDLAEAANFLCSPAAQFITGLNMIVDGGESLR